MSDQAAPTMLTRSEDETIDAALDLASTLGAGDIVLLYGDLGAGKTAFTRGLAMGLGGDPDDVSSPTFTIMQEYRGGRLPLFHVDLYRLSDPREIEDLGFEEVAAEGVLAVEWADRLSRSIPGAITVHIAHGDGDTRSIRIERS